MQQGALDHVPKFYFSSCKGAVNLATNQCQHMLSWFCIIHGQAQGASGFMARSTLYPERLHMIKSLAKGALACHWLCVRSSSHGHSASADCSTLDSSTCTSTCK